MKTQLLTLKAVSPLALHRRRASEQFAASLDYLPGSAIRGALADLYLQGNPDRAKDELFQRLFISPSENVTFSDFLPTADKSRTRLVPLSALTCKRFSEHESKPGVVTDSLMRLELADELDESGLLDLGGQTDPLAWGNWKHCQECRKQNREEKRDRAEAGYYTALSPFERVPVPKRMITGTAIERATGTAAHAMLFSHEVIEESSLQKNGKETLFRGLITLPDDLYDEVDRMVKSGQRLAVGYGRSRGLGQLESGYWQEWVTAERFSLRERWEMLNEAAKALWERFSRQLTGQYFTLTLQSHLALRNKVCEPILGDITAEDLGLPPEIERRRSMMTAVVVPGWNAAQNLPKPDSWALGRGSVLLFRLPAAIEPVLKRLEEIERNGLGERRAEGFGRVTVCDEFHYHFLQKELKGISQ
jgi:CRISPR-associated protein Csx10